MLSIKETTLNAGYTDEYNFTDAVAVQFPDVETEIDMRSSSSNAAFTNGDYGFFFTFDDVSVNDDGTLTPINPEEDGLGEFTSSIINFSATPTAGKYVWMNSYYNTNPPNPTHIPFALKMISTERPDGRFFLTPLPNKAIGENTKTFPKGSVSLYQQYTSTMKKVEADVSKGAIQGYISNANSSAYPQDGVSGSSWYDYQGSDNIDPTACSIPSTIMGGAEIQITVTPGTGKVYEGTVSYLYQVKLGDADWTTIATTTATSKNYTVPYGTTTFQVRVRAQDNLGFTSTDYVTSSSVTVINNQPPTAPGSIEVTNVVHGQQATITITAATDPDGTVESYIYERSVDGSAWQQIANVNALTYNDTINAEWGTVAYRAKAVDDDGDSGPYVTSQTSVVNSGWVIVSGPANDMGDKPAPFEFELSVSISGQETSDNITVDVTLDGKSVYSQAVAPNTPISIDVDTRTMRTGSHSFAVAASCDTYVPASGEYTFNVPEITIPDGGRMDRLEGQDGETIFPITLARAVAGLENYGVESKVHPGAYTGTGTYGTDNPNTLEFEFEPKMVLIQGTAGRVAILIKPSGVGVSIGPNESTTLNVTWQGKTVSWYNSLNAANQMNTENETYSYTAFG